MKPVKRIAGFGTQRSDLSRLLFDKVSGILGYGLAPLPDLISSKNVA